MQTQICLAYHIDYVCGSKHILYDMTNAFYTKMIKTRIQNRNKGKKGGNRKHYGVYLHCHMFIVHLSFYYTMGVQQASHFDVVNFFIYQFSL
jgi:hypothetical protein